MQQKMSFYSFIGRVLQKKSTAALYKISSQPNLLCRHCTVRRALLYVPGSDTKKLQKSLTLKADCIVMDCEDGVALNKKKEARENIRDFLDKGPVTSSDPEWCVRINPVQDQKLCEDDIQTILSAKNLPACLCLPKVNTVDQLQWFSEKVWNSLLKRPEKDRGPIKLLMLIESAVAIMTLPEICKKAADLSTMAPVIPVGLILGSDDLLASLGATRTNTNIELLYSRQKLVLVARAFGLQAVDMVFLNFKDQAEFEKNCKEGAVLGFTGKQVIHPNQVPVAQDLFVPSQDKIKWALAIIDAFNKNQQEGKGAFTFSNEMIDMPTVKQAQNIVNIAKLTGKIKNEVM